VTEPGTFSLTVPLPDALDASLRAWARATPRATWPAWGGHITLLTPFRVAAPLQRIETTLAALGSAQPRFDVRLRRVAVKPHIFAEGMWTTQLVIDEKSGASELRTLQAALHADLEDWIDESDRTALEASYEFHVSLVRGVPEAAAWKVAAAAERAGIGATFAVTVVELVALPTSAGEVHRALGRYELGAREPV
jgi:2'-5' RNA ligase